MSFTKWTDIEGLHHVIRNLDYIVERVGTNLPTVSYRAKIKLHGTNAGIRIDTDGKVTAQSRSQDIDVSNDNAGFAAWVETVKGYFRKVAFMAPEPMVIFGEWCGKGIMKGTSINTVDGRYFCIFAIQMGDQILIDPDQIDRQLNAVDFRTKRPDNVYVLPWYGSEMTVDYGDRDALKKFADTINDIVLQVEDCDPWVKDTFGVDGIGEGLVYYPVNLDSYSGFVLRNSVTNLMFKAKGEKHRVKKAAKAVSVDTETVNGVTEFVDIFVTEARLEQGVAAVCNGEYNLSKIGDFLKWLGQDVMKESVAELEASGLTWKDVSKQVTTAARLWYVQKSKEI